MRKFTDGNGNDSTAAVKAYLLANNKYQFADLYLIGETEDPDALWLTNWESPLAWPVWGTFLPATISRDKVTSQIGLEVTSMSVNWSPPLGIFGTPGSDLSSVSPYQLAQIGYYDNKKLRVWRTVMPTPGDANTFGACEWFGGWIGENTVVRNSIVFKDDSFLSVVNQMVPPNVISSQSTLAGYTAGTPVLADSETSVPTFTVIAPSSAVQINGQCIQPTAGKIYAKNRFIRGYMVFMPDSSLAGAWSAVAANVEYSPGGGLHYNGFTVYTPFPYDPTPGDTFYVATQPPINQSDPGNQYQDFPYVPDPETAL
jgi:hypothetical protein